MGISGQWKTKNVLSDPKDCILKPHLAVLDEMRDDDDDGRLNLLLALEDNSPSTSGRVSEDSELGGITGPDASSSKVSL